MLISAASPSYANIRSATPSVSPQVRSEQAPASLDQVQFSAASPEDVSSDGKIKWGPLLGVIGGVGLTSGLAASGFGWGSAIPAFAVGGAVGLAVTFGVVDKMISNGRDSSGTGPISAFAGVVGGIGGAVTAASYAFNHGSPMVGLGVGLAVTTLAAAGTAYSYHN